MFAGKLSTVAFVLIAAIAGQALAGNTAKPASIPAIGSAVADFSAKDSLGTTHALSKLGNDKVVVLAFVGVECPLAKLYASRLAELAAKYQSRDVVFLGVDSNRQDAATEISAFARQHKIEFPILKDLRQQIADLVGATRTPTVVVIDKSRTIRYRGRIDDQFGFVPNNAKANYQKSNPEKNDLAAAIDALLAIKTIEHAETDVSGCLIGRDREPEAKSAVTYSRDVAPILNQNCVACHRRGQIAPFSLTSYDESVGWADMIAEVTMSRRMPPWHADPQYGHFSNDCRLSDSDRETLVSWALSGAPEGDPKDLPTPPTFTDGWMIPQPDEVILMPKSFDVPATGVVEYQNFVVDTGWKEDRWISAIEAKPGNPAVVHHILIFLVSPDNDRIGLGSDNDFIGAFAPGLRPEALPKGMARFVKAGSKFIFQMHYTPNGSPQQDRSSLGIKFADSKSVEKEVSVSSAFNAVFQIPPGDANHEARARYVFKRDSVLLTMMPHMHLRGKDFQYEATYPDGRREMLLSVPGYDFGWQTNYRLTQPKLMPQGTVLNCVAHFDNSEDNLNNPDPKKVVTFGDQTFDEMMIGFFEMVPVAQDVVHGKQPAKLSRLEQFEILQRATKGELDDNLKGAAYMALADAEWISRFGEIIPMMLPQVDRVCVSAIDDGKLKPHRRQQVLHSRKTNEPEKETLRSPLPEVDAAGDPLGEAINANKTAVFDDLSSAGGKIFETMTRRGAKSSVHVPVTVDGKKMLVNFWSREAQVFPPKAVELLETLGKTMAEGQSKAATN